MGKGGYFIMFIKVKSSNRISKRVLLRSLVLVCQTDKSAMPEQACPLLSGSTYHRWGSQRVFLKTEDRPYMGDF